jgi:hypothetical protein
MRITLASVFLSTLLLGWLFFAVVGDYNLYVINKDGAKWVKQYATIADRLIFGFGIALIFAALNVVILALGARIWVKIYGAERTG